MGMILACTNPCYPNDVLDRRPAIPRREKHVSRGHDAIDLEIQKEFQRMFCLLFHLRTSRGA